MQAYRSTAVIPAPSPEGVAFLDSLKVLTHLEKGWRVEQWHKFFKQLSTDERGEIRVDVTRDEFGRLRGVEVSVAAPEGRRYEVKVVADHGVGVDDSDRVLFALGCRVWAGGVLRRSCKHNTATSAIRQLIRSHPDLCQPDAWVVGSNGVPPSPRGANHE